MDMTSRSASFDRRTRSEESWVEIASQPSSSSLSSINDDVVTTGLRIQHNPRNRRRRTLRPTAPSHLNITHRPASAGGGASSQEEYEESESESDQVMTSSGEGLRLPGHIYPTQLGHALRSASSEHVPQRLDSDDENRTAINQPISNRECFTPQPNAFSHPPSAAGQARHGSAPVPGSYFPSPRQPSRPTTRQSYPTGQERQPSHMPQNILSPSYNAAAQHDEALRASLTTLLSIGAAARSLSKPDTTIKRPQTTIVAAPTRPNRIEPISFRLLPESELPGPKSPPQHLHEPTFQPTIRRTSTSTSASTSSTRLKENKRKATPHLTTGGRSSSRERRALKKARRMASNEDLPILITPTLLTWVVSAGVVVFLSALSFSAGYSLGKEAGRFETAGGAGFVEEPLLRGCAREAGRSGGGMGLKRSLARSAVQV
ncbi:hypothetical protein LTR78_009557 [Recurvomyces mirabilis]|uniref:Uncharacterized protein n=1 Tax=Recurvomyces mirabilis TaxID=574656 RepID=A0AAE0TNM3_9PEZI|nr:hypothetical protein LTR78_009557 [Recurvomyces mirabilis]KAK5149988.1 hypothetical protein LTS14_010460 [Recurvomyces mirabilis]